MIQAYQAWLEAQGALDGEEQLRLYELQEQLRGDRLVLALVAEFSRGKTELINALFFSDFKRRLLPSSAGRTTMCPTELLYDERQEPYVRLLPIETRKTTVTVADYKKTPIHWTTHYIHNVTAPDELAIALNELTRTKRVSVREAQELGLYTGTNPPPVDATVEIPVWRHAIVNFPHPLLKQGLTLIDTPGLNALGAEPELTLNLLPSAHAMLYVLAADTGVTKSDLEVWTQHVRPAVGGRDGASLALLNKIDVLWDELADEFKVGETLRRQTEDVAKALDVDRKQVLPVSAQKALIGKIKDDANLILRSNISALESRLADDLLPARQEVLRDKVARVLGARLTESARQIAERLRDADARIAEVKQLGGKNQDTLNALAARLREEKVRYDREVEGFNTVRARLSEQAKALAAHLSLARFDALSAKTREDMQESWTTRGLKLGMTSLMAGVREQMRQAHAQSEAIVALVGSSYDRLHREYGLPALTPPPFSLESFRAELAALEAKAEAFRKSPFATMAEQHFVVKKFFITLMSAARDIFVRCNDTAKDWFRQLMEPVLAEIRAHKTTLDQRIGVLRKIHDNANTLSAQLAELSETQALLKTQADTVRGVRERLLRPLSTPGKTAHATAKAAVVPAESTSQ